MRFCLWAVVAACATAGTDPVHAVSAAVPQAQAVRAQGEGLENMLVELAAQKACDRIRGQMRALRAPDHAAATGTLWIRDCHATAAGQHVTFAITGSGWAWREQVRAVTEGSYTAEDYWRFDLSVVARGALAVNFDPGTQTATVTFAPTGTPSIDTIPTPYEKQLAGRPLAAQSIRDAVVGALSLAIAAPANAPQLADPMTDVFASGLVAQFPLCLGLEIVRLGTGKAFAEGAGKPTTPVEVEPHGLAMFGPQPARGPVTVVVSNQGGSAHASLICQTDAERVAQAYLEGTDLPQVQELAGADVQGEVNLHADNPGCPVVVMLRDTGKDKAVLRWWRPAADLQNLAGQPALTCAATRPQSQATPAP